MVQTTQTFTPPTPTNPLAKHFRQPAIYFKLPSKGAFWPDGAIELPVTGDIPVLPMSTKDEIVLRTPDALLNGQGVVNVIESCCPSIKDAWKMPSVDVDATIIAIRIASYGPQMDFNATCPHCTTQNEYAIDLTVALSGIQAPTYSDKVPVGDLKVKIKPQAYFSNNRSNMIAYEEQQILRAVGEMQDSELADENQKIFNDRLAKLIDINVLILTDSTDYIETPDGNVVKDPAFIQDFYRNCDATSVKAIRDKLAEYNKAAGIKPVTVTCKNEECAKEVSVDITFDWANFFGNGS